MTLLYGYEREFPFRGWNCGKFRSKQLRKSWWPWNSFFISGQILKQRMNYPGGRLQGVLLYTGKVLEFVS